ncbi:ralA-binding protein 1-like [Hydractinia symbiolongicarpus]|uniref:ralA-binding protein 1-like n=1 Tax=Hydractinia symbiolongicarpus TaxID=13093 RepID=UPI00254B7906|nr:ralA-binding protein 1-like [Hydractinia symbiolongicarpus]
MSDYKDSKENLPAETSSPKTHAKREKTKYQAFRSDEEMSSDGEEPDNALKNRRKIKNNRSNTFKVKIKKKGKKKEKEKEKEKEKDKEKDKKKKTKKSVVSGDEVGETCDVAPLHGPVFGVSLETAVERSRLPDKVELPRIVRECIMYVEEKGLDIEGIYRVSGVKSKVEALKQLFNEGRKIDLTDYDPNTVASLLKLFLRDLPSNILTTRLAPIFDSCVGLDDPKEQVKRFQQLIHDLPCANKTLLAWLFTHFLHVIDNGTATKMNIQNLSIVFSPTMSISHGVLNIFFTHISKLFPDTQLVSYMEPVEPEKEELSFPDTIEGLQEMLEENEKVLTELHARVNQVGDENESLMDELWERQRQSTQIKRELKTLKKKIEKVGTKENSSDVLKSVDNTKETEVKDAEPSVNNVTLKDLASKQSLNEVKEQVAINDIKTKKTKAKPPRVKKETWKAEITVTKSTSKADEITELTSQAKKNDDKVDNIPSKKQTLPSENDGKTDSILDDAEDDDEEYKALILEEKKLLLQNEELLKVGQLLKRKIQREQLDVEQLKSKLQEYQNLKDNSSSSSSSSASLSSSSRNSSCFNESEDSESEEDTLALEILLSDLEKQNKLLELQGKELIGKISAERNICAMIKSDIKFLEMKMSTR